MANLPPLKQVLNQRIKTLIGAVVIFGLLVAGYIVYNSNRKPVINIQKQDAEVTSSSNFLEQISITPPPMNIDLPTQEIVE